MKLIVKKATVQDAKSIHSLINRFAQKDEMLPRSLNEIYENIRNFFICKDKNKIIGVSALHIMWENLAEIRSIAVLKDYRNRGVGKKLIDRCLNEAKELGIRKVYILTNNPAYFIKTGFKDIDKNSLPQKIWGDCLTCPKFPECDEVAVIKTLK
jgi:amino-acid N-acetyltransferase